MYCRHCGKEINDDSTYCMYCGRDLTDNTIKENTTEASTKPKSDAVVQKSQEDSDGCSHWGCLLIVPFIVLAIAVIVMIAGSGGGHSVMTRDLESGDYSYTTQQDLTSYSITIVPNKDVDNCEIELDLYNSQGEVIFSDTITKTDLKKGRSYTYTFDFGFVNSLSGNKVKYKITGRCSFS